MTSPPAPAGSPAGWQPPPPSPPSAAWPTILWVVAGLAMAGALLFGLIGAAALWVDRALDDGASTEATVTAVDTTFGTAEVRYEAEGRVVETTLTYGLAEPPQVGDTLTVEYDPADPEIARIQGADAERLGATVVLVVAGIALVVALGATVGAILLHRARGRAKRRQAQYAQQYGGGYPPS